MIDNLLKYIKSDLSTNGLMKRYFHYGYWGLNIFAFASLVVIIYFLYNQNFCCYWLSLLLSLLLIVYFRITLEKKLSKKIGILEDSFRSYFIKKLSNYLENKNLQNHKEELVGVINERMIELRDKFIYSTGILSALFLILFSVICTHIYEKFVDGNINYFFLISLGFIVLILLLYQLGMLYRELHEYLFTSYQSLKYAKGLMNEVILQDKLNSARPNL